MNESALYASINSGLCWRVGVCMFSNSCFFDSTMLLVIFFVVFFVVFFGCEWICVTLVSSYQIVESLG